MIRRIIKTLSTAVLLSAFSVPAFGAEIPYEIAYNYENNSFTVSGNLQESKEVTFQLLKQGAENVSDINALYRNQRTADKNGEFEFVVELAGAESGKYKAYLMAKNEEKTLLYVTIVRASDYARVLENLKNNDNTNAELKSFVMGEDISTGLKNYEALGWDISVFAGLTEAEAEPLRAHIDGLGTSDAENTADFTSYMLMAALEKDSLKNAHTYIEKSSLKFDNEDLYNDYMNYSYNKPEEKEKSERQEYFTEKLAAAMSGTQNLENFEEAVKEALILSEVRYATGAGHLKEIIEKYGDAIDLTGAISKDACSKLSGEDFSSGTELKEEYERIAEKSEPGSGSSGGGGGSSSGKGSAAGVILNGAGTFSNEEKTSLLPINVRFEDLDGVAWASEAIHALADKGIVNGKSDKYFKPNDNITREEFVKIIICAMKLENETFEKNVFSDVEDGHWFCKYVNIAQAKGIVNGIGDAKFGTGMNITRQDMAVMICNALSFKNISLDTTPTAFEDNGEIADYAKDAVAALYNMGAVNGVSETEFAPHDAATRAQAAKMIYGVLGKLQ